MRDNYTHIIAILDESGSMEICKNDVKHGFDNFVREQRDFPGKCTFTLIKFNEQSTYVHTGVSVNDIPPLDFHPQGRTALYDAMGLAIKSTGEWLSKMEESERPSKVICMTFTDGENNASRQFTKQQIREMVELQTNIYKWHFVFLGANMDGMAEGQSLGVAAAAAASYSVDQTREAYRSLSVQTKSLRANQIRSFTFTDDDRRKLKSEKAG